MAERKVGHMRAAIIHEFGDPSSVRAGEIDDPLVGPDFVLIRVRAAGVNPVDWKIVGGGLQGAFPHHFPLVPGWDVAGEVVRTGPAVTEVAAGDRVAAYARKDHVQHGTFAELVSVPVRAVAKVPEGVDLVAAGALPLAGLTAEQLLEATGVRDGDTVLVQGASGGVGGFAVQLARQRGATVIGTASSANHEYVRGLGAEPVEYGDGLTAAVHAAAPEGVDVVIDLFGELDGVRSMLAQGGRVGSIADPAGVKELGGSYVFVRPGADMLARLLGYVAAGSLTVEVQQRYPLAEVAEALATSKAGHVRGKLVIDV